MHTTVADCPLLAFLGLVELLKVVNPQPRPTFLEWCKPNVKDNCTAGKLINEYECTNSELSSSLALSQIHTSFPSGHAAAAAYSMTYLMVGVILSTILLTFHHNEAC